MKNIILRLVGISVCLLIFCIVSNAQKTSLEAQDDSNSIGVTVIKGTGKAAIVVVGSAAKVAWKTTKVTGKYVAKPIFLKMAPAAGKYLFKTTARHLLPLAVKMSVL